MSNEDGFSLETLDNGKLNDLNIDNQIKSFAEIIISIFCNNDNINEKLPGKAD